jgi:glycosyltransferase involved in cell wall biosynthesis
MSQTTEISIVTPVFNSIGWIDLCVRSVRYACQGLSYEHIVCDGASTDGTLEYLKQQPDIRLIHGPDRGMYDALNKGMAAARGRILGHLNADEQYDRAGLAHALEKLEQTRADAVFGPTIMLDGQLNFLYLFNQITIPRPVDADYQMPVQTCSLFYRREIWQREPFPAEYRMAGDHVWVRRQFRHGWKLVSQAQPVGIFTWHPDQLAPRHIGGKRENPTPDVNRKSLPMKLAKLRYRFLNFLSGAVLPPARLTYEIVLPGGRVERREIRRPALKMPRTEKKRLALSRN